MALRFTAESLQDIAEMFDDRAKSLQTSAESTKGARVAAELLAAHEAWTEAASILRNTTLLPADEPARTEAPIAKAASLGHVHPRPAAVEGSEEERSSAA